MAGKRQKPISALQNKREGRADRRVLIPDVLDRTWPAAPRGIGPFARGIWNRLGKAIVSGAIDTNADYHALCRYIWEVHLWDTLTKRVAKIDPVVKGSTGQPAIHPIIKAIGAVEERLDRLEELLGLNPLARFRLGIASLEEQQKQRELAKIAPADYGPRKIGRDGKPVKT